MLSAHFLNCCRIQFERLTRITNIASVTIQPSTNTANDFDVITLNLVSGLKSEAFILSSCTSLANKSVTAINIISGTSISKQTDHFHYQIAFITTSPPVILLYKYITANSENTYNRT